MPKKQRRVLGIIITIVFLMFSVISPALAQPVSTGEKVTVLNDGERIFGSDRYETAVKISQSGWASSEYAILGAGMDQNLVDALAAAPLAKLKNAPILFSAEAGLTLSTQNELQRLEVNKVYLVTGKSTFEPALFEQLEKLKITVLPLGGSNRFQTAVNIARELGTPSEVVITTAWKNADALSMAAIAAAKGMPILLADGDKLPASVNDYLDEIKGSLTQSYIIGGQQAVGNAVQNLLPNGVRIGGLDRFATNIEVLKYFAEDFQDHNTFVVNGMDRHLVDALAIAPLAAKTFSPVVLTGTTLPEETQGYVKHNFLGNIIPIGGEGLVSKAVVDALRPIRPVTNNGGGGGGGSPVVTVSTVSVATPPDKTAYTSGETLDLSGLVVTLSKSDSTSENVAFADFAGKGLTASPASGTILITADTKVTLTHTASGKKVDQGITVAPATISLAALAGVAPPVTGEIPVSAISATAQYSGTVAWSPADNPFREDTVYTATITLSPTAEYTLTGVAADFFTVAGTTAVNNIADSGVITAVFPKTGPAPEFGGGAGTVGDPYQVGTPEHLNNIRNHLGAHFIQTADIDLETYLADGGAGYNAGAGWAPIGTTGAEFTGNFNGNGKTISNLKIARTWYIGLFGQNKGVIHNVSLSGVIVSGSTYVGGLVGYNYGGTVTDSNVMGSITSNATGDAYVGGLIGSSNYGNVSNSYSTSDVTGVGNRIGGLIGQNYLSTVNKCFATGNVTGVAFVGGLVGENSGSKTYTKITDSYSRGTVTGTGGYTGGLVGRNFFGPSVTNCYATGAVTGTGGLVGGVDSGATVIDSYWDTVTSGLATSLGGVGRTTAEMKDQTTFTGWDFAAIWDMDSAENNGYPFLR